MRGLLGLLALVLGTLPASGQGIGPRMLSTLGAPTQAAYTGVVDVIGINGLFDCWSTMACGAAKRTARAVNVCNAADAACVDMVTDFNTGALVVTSVGGTNCAATELTCTVKTMYGQYNGVDCTQATIASRPTLSVAHSNGQAFLKLTGGTQWCQTAASATHAQPNSMGGVFQGQGSGTGFPAPMALDTPCCELISWTNIPSSNARLYAGTQVGCGVATGGVLQVIDAVFNGAASLCNFTSGGIATSLNAGTIAPASSPFSLGAENGGTNGLIGYMAEGVLVLGTAWNSTTINSKQTNERARFGF